MHFYLIGELTLSLKVRLSNNFSLLPTLFLSMSLEQQLIKTQLMLPRADIFIPGNNQEERLLSFLKAHHTRLRLRHLRYSILRTSYNGKLGFANEAGRLSNIGPFQPVAYKEEANTLVQGRSFKKAEIGYLFKAEISTLTFAGL
jgi:hypothetical protein